MTIQTFKSFFLKQKMSNYILFILVFIITIIVSKFSFWYDINSFYTNLLRVYEGQTYFTDYFCQYLPAQYIFLSPLLKIMNLNSFVTFFSVILNFIFAFQFTYYSKKILNNEMNYYFLFILISFFFIPFGIGAAHHNELAIYFCSIGFLIAINNLERINFISIIYLVLGLTTKYSVAIPLIISMFLSFMIALIIDFKKKYLILFFSYIFICFAFVIFLVFYFLINTNISLFDFIDYLFVDTQAVASSRLNFKDFIFYNLFNEIYIFMKNITEIQKLPVGSILQLPIILSFLIFVIFTLKNIKSLNFQKRILFLFLVFSSILLWVFLGRDWNHKIIFFIISNYFLFFYFLNLQKYISKLKLNAFIFFIILLYLIVPINERIPLKNFIKNSNIELDEYLLRYSNKSPTIMFKRASFEEKNNINNRHTQYLKILEYLSSQNDYNLFFVDDVSTIFGTILSKAPNDTGCFHTWFTTPPINKAIRDEYIRIFKNAYYNEKNSKLIICMSEDGSFCMYSPKYNSNRQWKEVRTTRISENDFVNELISNSRLVYNTKNFFIFEKK